MCAPVGGLARANGVQETWLHLGFAFLTTFPASSVPCTCFFTFYVITGSLLRTAPLSKTPNLVQLLYGHLCGSICSKTAKMKLCRGQKLLPMQPLFVTLTSFHFGAQAFCRDVSWTLESWGVLWSLVPGGEFSVDAAISLDGIIFLSSPAILEMAFHVFVQRCHAAHHILMNFMFRCLTNDLPELPVDLNLGPAALKSAPFVKGWPPCAFAKFLQKVLTTGSCRIMLQTV